MWKRSFEKDGQYDEDVEAEPNHFHFVLLLQKNWNNGRKKFCREWTLRLDYRVLHCSC